MEYMTLIVFILSALLVMQYYIVHGFSGRWKSAGDTFGDGRQYDPRPWMGGAGNGTLDCFYDAATGNWVDSDCFDAQCDCTLPPDDPSYATRCTQCKTVTCRENGGFCN